MEENRKIKNPNAFPSSALRQGMTLRDYFAAKAMLGIITTLTASDIYKEVNHKFVSDKAYKIADLMLKQREL